MKRKQTKYNCRQPELYTVTTMAWRSCLNNLPRFEEWSTLYSVDYIEAQLRAVEAAAALPDVLERNSREVSLRIQLMECAKDNLYNWQRLKLYINRAMREPFATTAIKAAGSVYYEKAANNSWSQMQNLLNSAVCFIGQNRERLVANHITPVSFLTTFASDVKRFIDLLDSYYKIENDNGVATEAKVDANNAIYTELVKMLNDAKLIFKQEIALKGQFVFSTLVQKINSVQPAVLSSAETIENGVNVDGKAVTNTAIHTKNETAVKVIMPQYTENIDQQKVA